MPRNELPYDDPWGGWRDDALCLQIGDSPFFPDDQVGLRRQAYAICEQCPVSKFCFEYAVETADIQQGIWGGKPMADIRAERKRRGISERSTTELVESILRGSSRGNSGDRKPGLEEQETGVAGA